MDTETFPRDGQRRRGPLDSSMIILGRSAIFDIVWFGTHSYHMVGRFR